MVYVIFIIISVIILVVFFCPRFGKQNPLVYISITGLIGSLSVMGCKGLGVALKQTFNGNNQLTNWLTWFIIFSVIICLTTQLNYMNKALDIFNTAVVSPILYVIFTTFVILASAILFKEWGNLNAQDCVGNLCGFLTIVAGVFLLQAFKDLNITVRDLTRIRQQPDDSTGSSGMGSHNKLNGSAPYTRLDEESRVILLDSDHSVVCDDDGLEMSGTRK